jgi:hypothetical protein
VGKGGAVAGAGGRTETHRHDLARETHRQDPQAQRPWPQREQEWALTQRPLLDAWRARITAASRQWTGGCARYTDSVVVRLCGIEVVCPAALRLRGLCVQGCACKAVRVRLFACKVVRVRQYAPTVAKRVRAVLHAAPHYTLPLPAFPSHLLTPSLLIPSSLISSPLPSHLLISPSPHLPISLISSSPHLTPPSLISSSSFNPRMDCEPWCSGSCYTWGKADLREVSVASCP